MLPAKTRIIDDCSTVQISIYLSKVFSSLFARTGCNEGCFRFRMKICYLPNTHKNLFAFRYYRLVILGVGCYPLYLFLWWETRTYTHVDEIWLYAFNGQVIIILKWHRERFIRIPVFLFVIKVMVNKSLTISSIIVLYDVIWQDTTIIRIINR